MTDEILTTAAAAGLLGVSTRTVQLWIEGGTLASWKTPGGHRRVRRSAVEAVIATQMSTARRSSALVTLIAAQPALDIYRAMLLPVAECVVDAYDNPLTAMRAIGARAPFAIVIDVESFNLQRATLMDELLKDARLSHTSVIAISRKPPGTGSQAADRTGRMCRIPAATADTELPATLRRLFVKAASIQHGEAVPNYPFPVAANEADRLLAVQHSGLLGSNAEAEFDRLTRMASSIVATPFSLVTLLTRDEQWFKSRHGMALEATPRDWAFCNYTILQRGVFAVHDLSKDARFSSIPGVVQAPQLRFYAGAPIFDEQGFALGSVCVMDIKPRRLSEMQKTLLLDLAAVATDEIRLAKFRHDASAS
ncbi:GAF domain-containing protein [Burkholderia sp. 3C]